MPDMFRTRFKKEIVAEFLPPAHPRKNQKLIILCDGMPSIPGKQPLAGFLAGKGFWIIYPRYRGAWESGGEFLEKSPHRDILDILDDCRLSLRKLHSVVASGWHRIKSLSLAEASAVRRPSCYRLIHELSGLSQTARLRT